jgi:hypothetical protein
MRTSEPLFMSISISGFESGFAGMVTMGLFIWCFPLV